MINQTETFIILIGTFYQVQDQDDLWQDNKGHGQAKQKHSFNSDFLENF